MSVSLYLSNVSDFKKLITAISKVNDVISLVFDNEGINSFCMDMSSSFMIHLNLPSHSFEKYENDASGVIGIPITPLLKLLKNVSPQNSLLFEYGKGDDDHLHLTFQKGDCELEMRLRLIEEEYEKYSMPEKKYDLCFEVNTDFFSKCMSNFSNFGDHLTIEYDPTISHKVHMKTDGEHGSVRLSFGKEKDMDALISTFEDTMEVSKKRKKSGTTSKHEVRLLSDHLTEAYDDEKNNTEININLSLKFMKTISEYPLSEKANVRIINDYPLRYEVCNHRGWEIIYYVAPFIDDYMENEYEEVG